MHEYILAIQNLLVVIHISYKPSITKFNIINEIKKTNKKCFLCSSYYAKDVNGTDFMSTVLILCQRH
jgi:hypothetical protein